MSFGKMNTFIDLITTQPIKDAEGFVNKGDISLHQCEPIRRIAMAMKAGKTGPSLPMLQRFSDLEPFPALLLKLTW